MPCRYYSIKKQGPCGPWLLWAISVVATKGAAAGLLPVAGTVVDDHFFLKFYIVLSAVSLRQLGIISLRAGALKSGDSINAGFGDFGVFGSDVRVKETDHTSVNIADLADASRCYGWGWRGRGNDTERTVARIAVDVLRSIETLTHFYEET